jgi:hypothetical protein
MNKINVIMPKKWRFLAACLPLNIFGYLGNLTEIAGDIAAPVAL